MHTKPPSKLMPLKAVLELPWLPERPHLSTVYDWAKNGRRGVRLRTMWCSTLCTTEEWLVSFFEQLAGNAIEEEKPRTPEDREKAISRAERELEAAGI